MKVLNLKVGDKLRDQHGTIGRVVGFKIDGVVIEWPDGRHLYGDDELRMSGLVMVSALDSVASSR